MTGLAPDPAVPRRDALLRRPRWPGSCRAGCSAACRSTAASASTSSTASARACGSSTASATSATSPPARSRPRRARRIPRGRRPRSRPIVPVRRPGRRSRRSCTPRRSAPSSGSSRTTAGWRRCPAGPMRSPARLRAHADRGLRRRAVGHGASACGSGGAVLAYAKVHHEAAAEARLTRAVAVARPRRRTARPPLPRRPGRRGPPVGVAGARRSRDAPARGAARPPARPHGRACGARRGAWRAARAAPLPRSASTASTRCAWRPPRGSWRRPGPTWRARRRGCSGA